MDLSSRKIHPASPALSLYWSWRVLPVGLLVGVILVIEWKTAQQGAFTDGELIVAHVAFGVCLVLHQVGKKDRA